MRVLVVEDELRMASLIRRGLVPEGLAADVAPSGEDALWMAEAHEYDAIVLDVMLPGIDGFETCRRLRESGVWSPVLMLTARDAVEDRVAGLDSGADDYLVKPFAFAELLARLRALVRRGERRAAGRARGRRPAARPRDPARSGAADGEIALSAKEFALLETFMRRPGEVLSRLHLLEHAWDFAYETRSNVVDVYVRRLRREDRRAVRPPLARDRARRRLPAARGRSVSGLPIRVRVTAAFAVAMALVLAASGWFLYARLGAHLADAARQELQVRAQDLAALVRQPSASLAGDSGGRLIERGESFAQLVDRAGGVVDATPPLGSRVAPEPGASCAPPSARPLFANRSSGPGPERAARALLATPVERGGRQLVLVVGATRGNDAETLASLPQRAPDRRADRAAARLARRLPARRARAAAGRGDAPPRGRDLGRDARRAAAGARRPTTSSSGSARR